MIVGFLAIVILQLEVDVWPPPLFVWTQSQSPEPRLCPCCSGARGTYRVSAGSGEIPPALPLASPSAPAHSTTATAAAAAANQLQRRPPCCYVVRCARGPKLGSLPCTRNCNIRLDSLPVCPIRCDDHVLPDAGYTCTHETTQKLRHSESLV